MLNIKRFFFSFASNIYFQLQFTCTVKPHTSCVKLLVIQIRVNPSRKKDPQDILKTILKSVTNTFMKRIFYTYISIRIFLIFFILNYVLVFSIYKLTALIFEMKEQLIKQNSTLPCIHPNEQNDRISWILRHVILLQVSF